MSLTQELTLVWNYSVNFGCMYNGYRATVDTLVTMATMITVVIVVNLVTLVAAMVIMLFGYRDTSCGVAVLPW